MTPDSLSFSDLSQTSSFTVSEAAYGGTFTQNSPTGCAGIVSVSPATAGGPSATFNATSQGAGSCTLTVSDDHGGSVSIPVSVTVPSPTPTPTPTATPT
ncbi:MAG: hypothetical protein DLM53_10280, partial [Candidatus Eremiobacter antarcticus]